LDEPVAVSAIQGLEVDVMAVGSELSQAPTVAEQESIGDDSFFDDFWQNALNSELNPDLNAWDGLFSAMDSRPL
jgi:hypothetical protein